MAYLHNWYKNSYFINLETKEIFKDTFNAHGDYINGYLSFNGNGGCGIVDTPHNHHSPEVILSYSLFFQNNSIAVLVILSPILLWYLLVHNNFCQKDY